MAGKKRKSESSGRENLETKAVIENAGVVLEQTITETLEKNYMPYAMSVILSRAIPEIDGFKPSHRKLLYTMYKMGLLNGARTKSANIVGQTMRLNPHGDAPIYETMVRLSRGNEALLHPFVDSKGNFGKAYSRDMAYAAPRYTEAKLAPVAKELFADIELGTVDFVDNYDNTTKEPLLLPVSYPSVLVNANIGIAVGMASAICPFNLGEVCSTTIALLKNPDHDLGTTLVAPDFPGGGHLVYDAEALARIYETGRGGIKVRARYRYDESGNYLEITEIPPTTTVEAIIEKVVDLVKNGKLKEIVDIRDETDLGGLKITMDLRRGSQPDAVIRKLYQMTPLEDTFSCNFNLLVRGAPQVLGIRQILTEWTEFRRQCVRRRTEHQLQKQQDKLHLLKGLERILLDIDKAVKIVRETENENEVIPNLMIGFGIDTVQAEYVADIRLRQLNREYILKRTAEIGALESEIADLEDILAGTSRIDLIMVAELEQVAKIYGQPRKTLIYHPTSEDQQPVTEQVADYPVFLFLTAEGYFKKIIPASLRMSSEQKLKENDRVVQEMESTNRAELLFFTDRCQVYKTDASNFDDTKASAMGDYLPAALDMDDGEAVRYLVATTDYSGAVVFVFADGRVAKVELKSYETKTKRKKLVNAYSDKAPLVAAFFVGDSQELLLQATSGRKLIFDTAILTAKTMKNTQGVKVMSLKKGAVVDRAVVYTAGMLANDHRYRVKNLPGAGALPKPEDVGEQMIL